MDDRIRSELMERWQESRRQGLSLSFEDLCADFPDEIEDLKKHLHAVEMSEFQELSSMPPAKDSPEATDASAADMTPAPDTQALPREGQEAARPLYDFLAPPQAMDEVGRLGPYRVLKVLGAGGMGIVFLAEDVNLNRQVALKVMQPDVARTPVAKERFLREARAAAAIEHENIVAIYQVGEWYGVPFLAMQWLKGMSLEDRLRRAACSNPPVLLSTPQVLRVGRQIAKGLAAAHAHGLIHRDIKPDNLWLSPEHGGRIKILDFGLARPAMGKAHLTQSGAVVGTPSYMAPEQGGGGTVDARCDLFSLGVVLYRMCTGELPFRGENVMAVLVSLATEQPKPVRELNPAVPPALADLVMQLLSKDPSGRPASAKEVARKLAELESELTAPSRAEAVPLALPVTPTLSSNPWAEIDATELMPALPQQEGSRKRPVIDSPRYLRAWIIAAVVILLAFLPLYYFFGDEAQRIAANEGQVVFKVDDPKTEVTVKKNGVVIQERQGQRAITLPAGDHELEVSIMDADGRTFPFVKTVTLNRGSKVIVNVRDELPSEPVPPRVESSGDRDRDVAVWVLSRGGSVFVLVSGQELQIARATDLPAAKFQLTLVNLPDLSGLKADVLEQLEGLSHLKTLYFSGPQFDDGWLEKLKAIPNLRVLVVTNSNVSDAGLTHLKAFPHLRDLRFADARPADSRISDTSLERLKVLPNLEVLWLVGCRVGDAGLAHLKALPHLSELNLQGTLVTDAGLEHLKALPNLSTLMLQNTQVSDAGMEQLRALPNLRSITLTGTVVSDAGLVHLKTLPKLSSLLLNSTQVSDNGLVHLKGMPNLTRLDLARTRVSDAGLVHLRGHANLGVLELSSQQITDAGLEHLLNFPRLIELFLQGTRVSAKGCATLKAAYPQISDNIRWSEPNYTTAQTVLALGGSVHIRVKGTDEDRPVTTAAELPTELFQTRRIVLRGVQKPLPSVLINHLAALTNPEFDRLEMLDLSGSTFGDDELGILALITSLTDVSLAKTQISDKGLGQLRSLTELRRLDLDGTHIKDIGLAVLIALPKLTELRLGCPRLTLDAIDWVGKLKQLEKLSLANSSVTDDGLKRLHGLSNLQELDLTGTKVGAASVAELQKAVPGCRIKK